MKITTQSRPAALARPDRLPPRRSSPAATLAPRLGRVSHITPILAGVLADLTTGGGIR